jgi:hypothetical protein
MFLADFKMGLISTPFSEDVNRTGKKKDQVKPLLGELNTYIRLIFYSPVWM